MKFKLAVNSKLSETCIWPSVIWRTQIHTAQPLVPEPSVFEFEMAIERIKRQITGIGQIPAEFIKAGGRKIRSEIHKSNNYI